MEMKSRFRGFLPVVLDLETGGFECAKHAVLEIAALTLDSVLLTNEGHDFVAPAYTTLYAAFTSVCVAGGVVVICWLYDLVFGIDAGFLPAAFTSLITGPARGRRGWQRRRGR